MSQDYSIVHGEVVDTLQSWGLTDYYDACLCDPPYLLEFMGKAFDKQHKAMAGDNDGQRMYQWHLRWCREVYKVLKPGGFVLAFGGTRTSHRLACALEDVGFEVRDTIEWMYGSGFPKSYDISKGVDKINGETGRKYRFTEWMRGTGISSKELDGITETNMGGHYLSSKSQPAIPTRELFDKIKSILSVPIPDWVEELIDRVEAERPVVGRSTKARSTTGKSALPTLGGETRYETWDLTSAGRDDSALWSGYGTALKPSHEPLVLAMKPCQGTFAENALEHGVAGLNIDECRIGMATDDARNSARPGHSHKSTVPGTIDFGTGNKMHSEQHPSGRWPANLILTHTPYCQEIGTRQVQSSGGKNPHPDSGIVSTGGAFQEKKQRERFNCADENGLETISAWDCHPLCPVRLLDEQSGDRGGGYGRRGTGGQTYGSNRTFQGDMREVGYGDSGGASRFFYCAKVSTRERNLGGTDCKHPTLKPIDLCRYLATLLLPPPRPDDTRKLLIPFSGAGSEVAGSLLAGWNDVTGIEQDAEYVQWSEARIQAVLRGELQEKRSGSGGAKQRRSTGVDTLALADLFTEG